MLLSATLCMLALVQSALSQDPSVYIKPISSSAICPGLPCLTLSPFAEATERYLTTGSRIAFLPGKHDLQTELVVENLRDIALRGISSTETIFLSKNATILCKNISNFHVKGLKFVLCKHQCIYSTPLKVINSQGMISNCTFLGSGNETLSTEKSIYLDHSNITVLNCHFERNSGGSGVIQMRRASILTIAGSKFIRNRSTVIKSFSVQNHLITLAGTTEGNFFRQNVGSSAVLECTGCTLVLKGRNQFIKNKQFHHSKLGRGGAININFGILKFASGEAMFAKNEAPEGGAISISSSDMICPVSASVIFDGNKAKIGGGMSIYRSKVDAGECRMTFTGNVAEQDGGGIHITAPTMFPIPSELFGTFADNRARCGGAISIKMMENITLSQISCINNSDSALCIADSTVLFQGTSKILNNTGEFGGGVFALNSVLTYKGYTFLTGNSADSGGGVYQLGGSTSYNGFVEFAHNMAEVDGGAIYASGTILNVSEVLNFKFNSARKGGAVYTIGETFMVIHSRTKINSSFNKAHFGGGIYHVDNPDQTQCSYGGGDPYTTLPNCFMQFKTTWESSVTKTIKLTSYHDHSEDDGDYLYGGLLDRCQINSMDRRIYRSAYQALVAATIFVISTSDNSTRAVTSKPYGLCFCDAQYHCVHNQSRNITIQRGHRFTVALLAFAQGNSVAASSVTAITSPTASLKLGQNSQQLLQHCSTLVYNVFPLWRMKW